MSATTTTPGIVQRLAALLLLLALLALLALGGRLWLGHYQFYQTHIEQLQDRLLRLQRMAALKPQLEQVIADLRADQSNAAQFLPGNAPPLAAAELQQRVKRTVEAAGGELLSAQVLPVAEEGGVL
ncbi:MAG TPA: type II secretion system protein GspM, partial [Candidatus Competibacteraceae bacterium]|nr:type II secretion system protein GspM [Candidatus Competibacteraceae bacterium]